MYEANNVAKWLLSEAKQQGIAMTHMKLQKLLYYVQAYHIGMTGEPLFSNDIEAWTHGPVVPDVYAIYSKYGSSEISEADDITPPDDIRSLIVAVFHDKGRYTAYTLSGMTHNENSWREAINSASKRITPDMLNKEFTPEFWNSDEEDEFQPSFETEEEEKKYFLNNITEEERNAIFA